MGTSTWSRKHLEQKGWWCWNTLGDVDWRHWGKRSSRTLIANRTLCFTFVYNTKQNNTIPHYTIVRVTIVRLQLQPQLSQNPSPPTATSTALDLGVDLSRGCFRQHLKALTFEHSALCTLEMGQWSKDGHWWPFWTGSIFEPIQRGGSLFIQPMAMVGFLLPPINWNCVLETCGSSK